jgi:hypothetical protein
MDVGLNIHLLIICVSSLVVVGVRSGDVGIHGRCVKILQTKHETGRRSAQPGMMRMDFMDWDPNRNITMEIRLNNCEEKMEKKR